MRRFVLAAVLLPSVSAQARAETPAEAAAVFGARPAVEQASISPNGSQVAFLAPAATGQGSTLFTVSTAEGAVPAPALSTDGKPSRLRDCHWVSDTRLVCTVFGVVKTPDITLPLPFTRLFAVDAKGGNQRLISNVQMNRQGAVLGGGRVIDWLSGSDGKIMMARHYQRTDQTGTNIGSQNEGLGVDVVDTRNASHSSVETPKRDAVEFITDGKGSVRIAGYAEIRGQTQMWTGRTIYRYRPAGSREWQDLGPYDRVHRVGFEPYAVDAEKNVAYGFKKLDGRMALYAKSLDGSGAEKLILSRPDVDVDGLIRIGRNGRVIGASYTTDRRTTVYFDPEMDKLVLALQRALPKAPLIQVVDASADETKLLLFAGSDVDAGHYYLFDRTAKRLQILLEARPQAAGKTLAPMQATSFRAADGTVIPAYLTLPQGGEGKNLPAIVLPHGGPSARDEWGFDWLVQFYAARGYAVLQPQFRGSSGYGDAYFLKNGFQSWRTAIGDVVDAGRWLVAQGIARPGALSIVGWSYGGYAALQSAVVDPTLFKAVVAIAPVTDLATLKEESRNFDDFRVQSDFISAEPAVVRDGSPAQNAAKIKAPVLLVHGGLDRNVGYGESALMQSRLAAAGGKVELMSFPDLDHYLEDSSARTQMLERSDAFIRSATGG